MDITNPREFSDAELLAMPRIAALVEKAKFDTGVNERLRILAIINSPEAKQRPKLAAHLATHTSLAPDIAATTLATAPRENSAGNDYLAAALAGDIVVQGFDPHKAGGVVDPKEARKTELKAAAAAHNATRV